MNWFEDEDFWEKFYPIMFPPRRWEITSSEVEQIIDLLSLKPNQSILDLCCGPGRHSVEFAHRGFEISGVDRTEFLLNKARKKAQEDELDIQFIQSDMRDFCQENSFDIILNLFTSFGYFKDIEEDKQVLKNMLKTLRPGGKILFEMAGREPLAKYFRPRDWREQAGYIILEERTLSQNWTWIDNRWILLKEDQRHEFHIGHRLFGAVDLSQLLLECGFNSVTCFGELDGRPYDHEAKRLVVVASKA